jgi:hypothetical protein
MPQAGVGGLDAQEGRAARQDVTGPAIDFRDHPVAGRLEFEDRLVALQLGDLLALGHPDAGLHLDVDNREFVDGRAHGGHGDVDQKQFHAS